MSGLKDLTPRELEILLLTVDSNSKSDIAKALCISKDTVKTHLFNVYGKLGIVGSGASSKDELWKTLIIDILGYSSFNAIMEYIKELRKNYKKEKNNG
jgi:DNA-binding CsgD family transcriptional regulator